MCRVGALCLLNLHRLISGDSRGDVRKGDESARGVKEEVEEEGDVLHVDVGGVPNERNLQKVCLGGPASFRLCWYMWFRGRPRGRC